MGSPPPTSGPVPGASTASAAAKAATSACEALQAAFQRGLGPGGQGTPQSSPAGSLSVQASQSVQATCCGFAIQIPTAFKIAFKIPPIKFDLSGIVPYLGFGLSCQDPTRPVNQVTGVPWGGGRVQNNDPDLDDDENAY